MSRAERSPLKYAFTIDQAAQAAEVGTSVDTPLQLIRGTTAGARFRVAERPVISDCQVDSLKVLALTLLREIDAIESTPEATTPLSLSLIVQRFEAEIIRSALIKTGGRQRPAARLLGMKVTTLHAKIRRYKLDQSRILPVIETERLTEKAQRYPQGGSSRCSEEIGGTAFYSARTRTRGPA